MDFTNRSVQQPAAPRAASGGAPAGNGGGNKSSKNAWRNSPSWLRIVWIILLFSVTILAVSMVALLYVGGAKKEIDYLKKDRFQAVFMQNGQVYFGKIKAISGSHMDLQEIYYLSVDQAVQPEQADTEQNKNVSLVKLGCELHGPIDQMIVNREQVTFWENLKSDGQVSEAIKKWQEQNPNGQECKQTASDTPASTGTEETSTEE